MNGTDRLTEFIRPEAPPPASVCCHYCGLAIPGLSSRSSAAAEPAWCCYGCRVAESVQAAASSGEPDGLAIRLGLGVFLSMNVLVFSMVLWTQDSVHAADAGDFARLLWSLCRHASLALSAPVLFLLGWPLAENAARSLSRRQFNADVLLVAGVAAAFLYSAVSVHLERGHVYFEVACVILLAVTLGRWIEATGRKNASAALDALESLLPDQVERVGPSSQPSPLEGAGWEGGVDPPRMVPLNEISIGDRIRVSAGSVIPADGVIIRGCGAVDERLLTGEAEPRPRGVGDRVLAGSTSLDGELELEVAAPPGAGALGRIIELVRRTERTGGSAERLADRVTRWFIPFVAALALGATAWHGAREGWMTGLEAGLAMLIIACPCSLAMATPIVLRQARGAAVARQILITDPDALDRLTRLRSIRFDKTGTLTADEGRVVEELTDAELFSAAVRARTFRITAGSNHPAARAIADRLRADTDPTVACPARLTARPGRGLEAEFPDGLLRLGSLEFVDEPHAGRPGVRSPLLVRGERLREAGLTVSAVSVDGRIAAVFGVAETVRPGVRETLAELTGRGFDVAVLTGDHAERGRRLAEELGVRVEADLRPEDKVERIEEARALGPVAMVGDGVNDAPALARADVSVAMGCGADVTRDLAHVCLLGNDPARLIELLDLARAARRIVRGNLIHAFAYNILGIGWALTGSLHPTIAAAAMTVSSILVTLNSTRLTMPTPAPSSSTAVDGELPSRAGRAGAESDGRPSSSRLVRGDAIRRPLAPLDAASEGRS